MMSKKIKIGVSSCLLGNNVRYDGGHRRDHCLRDTLGQFVKWLPVCPEVESGMLTPREPMQLMDDGVSLRLVTAQTGVDQAWLLSRWAGSKLKQLERDEVCGFVFKARSPSCGIHDAEIVDSSGGLIRRGPGLFVAEVAKRFPSLPLEDEVRLQDPVTRENFIERIFAYQRWRKLLASKAD